MTEKKPAHQNAQGYGIAQAQDGSIAIVNISSPPPRRRKFWLEGLILIFLFLVSWGVYSSFNHPQRAAEQKLKGIAGEWLYDPYIGLLIPKQMVGTLLADDNYDLELDLENRTSMAMEVTKIEVETYNHEAAVVFGIKGDLVHTSTHNVPESIKPNGKATVSIVGNQILPNSILVRVYHTLSGTPSMFEIDLTGKRMPMPSPRQLPARAIYRGTDAVKAVISASKIASAWGKNVTIVAAFPGDHEIFIDFDSRLKFVEVKNWVVTFYSFTLNRFYTVIVRGDKVEGKDYTRSEGDLDVPEQRVELPRIGNQQALAIANQDDLLCADWKEGPRLATIDVEGTWIPAWFLPYRGPDSLPIIVDARTGDLVVMSNSNGGWRHQ